MKFEEKTKELLFREERSVLVVEFSVIEAEYIYKTLVQQTQGLLCSEANDLKDILHEFAKKWASLPSKKTLVSEDGESI